MYSNDGTPLFSTMLQVKTRALAYGYLQLANYDRDNRNISPLNSYPLRFDNILVELPDNSPIYLNVTSQEFSSMKDLLTWKTFHIMISDESVTSINNSNSVSVYTKDRVLLFTIAFPAAEFVRKTGKLEIANYKNRNVNKLLEIELIP